MTEGVPEGVWLSDKPFNKEVSSVLVGTTFSSFGEGGTLPALLDLSSSSFRTFSVTPSRLILFLIGLGGPALDMASSFVLAFAASKEVELPSLFLEGLSAFTVETI